MKKLSDYKDEEAFELWADILEPLSEILTDNGLKALVASKQSYMVITRSILKKHRKEAEKILLRIDPTPLNGLNLVTRLLNLITELAEDDELKPFFNFAEQTEMSGKFSGSVMENTEDSAK